MLIRLALVANCVIDSLLANLTVHTHHVQDDQIHCTIQPPWNALIESDKIRLQLVHTVGTNALLLNEGNDASFLQNLSHVLEHSIVCCQMRPPSEPRVAKHPIGCVPVRNNMDWHAGLKTEKSHPGVIRELKLQLKKKAKQHHGRERDELLRLRCPRREWADT